MRTYFQILKTTFLALGLILSEIPYAQAQPIYLNGSVTDDPLSFIGHYDSVQSGMGTAMGNCYSCYICHTAFPENADNLSPYAIAWRTAWVTLEPARTIDEPPDQNAIMAFGNIESADADGDGASNITEIRSISNPGNAASTPSTPGACPNAPGQSGGGSFNSASSLGSNNAPFNANTLNPKCGFQSMAGVIKNEADPVQQTETVALFFLPLLTLFLLKKRYSWTKV